MQLGVGLGDGVGVGVAVGVGVGVVGAVVPEPHATSDDAAIAATMGRR